MSLRNFLTALENEIDARLTNYTVSRFHRQLAFSTEMNYVTSSIGTSYEYIWVDRRTWGRVAPPWLGLGLLPPEVSDNVVLMEVPTGGIVFSFGNITYLPENPQFNQYNFVTGTEQNNRFQGGSTSDVIFGYSGNDFMVGGDGDDVLLGGKGQDRISGGRGNDILVGEDGNNILQGNKGKDIFSLDKGAGRTLIRDFQDKQDQLMLGSGVSFRKLDIEQRGNRTFISAGRDLLAVLNGVRENQITRTDFVAG